MNPLNEQDYILDRIKESDSSILVFDGEKRFWLPKDKITILQEDPIWKRRLPDVITVWVPDTLATLHEMG